MATTAENASADSTSEVKVKPGFQLKMLGAPAPVFPGFEIDILTKLDDHEKPDAVWHRERAKAMCRAHPELKELMGNAPGTAFWCLAMAFGHIALAISLSGQPWWLALAAAWVLGVIFNFNLFMLGHECNHGLVFKSWLPNRWLFTITTLPMCLTLHHTWWIDHPVHHNDLGAKKDFIKRRRTFFLWTRRLTPMLLPYSLMMVVLQVVRSAIGLCVYLGGLLVGRWKPDRRTLSILGESHLISGLKKHNLTGWAVLYPALGICLLATIGYFFGWIPVIYLIASAAFFTGFLHPLAFGMILSNSHFHGHKRYQPSSSYYGWLNWITFNFGLHTEHHDLCRVPWHRLPKIRKIAPEFYDPLVETDSYTGLALDFVTCSNEEFELRFDNEAYRNSDMLTALGGSHDDHAEEPATEKACAT